VAAITEAKAGPDELADALRLAARKSKAAGDGAQPPAPRGRPNSDTGGEC
jgi:hypothetical protein